MLGGIVLFYSVKSKGQMSYMYRLVVTDESGRESCILHGWVNDDDAEYKAVCASVEALKSAGVDIRYEEAYFEEEFTALKDGLGNSYPAQRGACRSAALWRQAEVRPRSL